ncbi:MAG: bifunctional phosphoribosylaminoimidazolecarboxamide formyltransferase/IMP cyclohydrolase [Armatimonadota bacterium]|nr:bifunctional phosphoribosylaminoimidazolecarboxamide formyltransferase/IMP cyclohydrolase [Armatimonadota bacterium]MDR5703754.1 bifunctional phosphoribosylaminoimidazolecarboxamide formyltransferase/IMP cyclohydrolase [Armatimonadota bacterium]
MRTVRGMRGEGAVRVARALLSVYDKTGLVEFAKDLEALGVELISTEGTGRLLREAGLPVRFVSELTGFPEVLGGRVKTLHPAIFAAILARRGREDDERQLRELGLDPIDLVVINLYPFERAVMELPLGEALEYIDIGGVALLRAAAKNWPWVGVVSHPRQYPVVLAALRQGGGKLPEDLRRKLAWEAFQATATYDAAIAAFLGEPLQGFSAGGELPQQVLLSLRKVQDLRYGENPHQQGALYRILGAPVGPLVGARLLHGKALSYNNFLDLEVAWGLVNEFSEPAACIIKHASPCGVGVARTLEEAYRKAREADPVSSFGGIVGLNQEVDGATAREISTLFVEAVIAPGFAAEALEILSRKKNLRILAAGGPPQVEWEFRSVSGGILVQEVDRAPFAESSLTFVTSHKPTPEQMEEMRFAWKVVKWAKSNAIVIARDRQTVGIGAGQPNRVDAVRIAVRRAGEKAQGAVLASDGFFPFPDGVEEAARAGVTAIIQPGGSVRDAEVIAAAQAHGIAMVLTGVRHFRH